MDMIFNGAIASAVSAVVAFLIWLVLHRPREQEDQQVDRLRVRVDNLESQRVAKMEEQIEAARKSRGALHDDMALRVSRNECEDRMQKIEDRWGSRTQEFTAAELKLERVGERVDAATKRIEAVSQDLIHTQTELALLTGRIEALKGR